MTLTRSDGSEHIRLVGIDTNQRRQVDVALDRTLDELARIIGSPNRAQDALLALLGERLLVEQHHIEQLDMGESVPFDFTERRIRHG